MSIDQATHRRITVISNGTQMDVAAPTAETIGRALAAVGVRVQPPDHVLLTKTGTEVTPHTVVSSLDDGALLTVVDLAQQSRPRAPQVPTGSPSMRSGVALWWLLSAASLVLAVGAVHDIADGVALIGDDRRAVAATAIGLGSLLIGIGAVVQGTRRRARASTMVATALLMAFATGVVATPSVESSAHLAVTIGMLGVALLASVLRVTASDRGLQSMTGTATVIALVIASIWGATLLMQWTASAAAAITLGIVAPGLRFIPSTLLNLPENYSISFRHFMGNRWTVRGTVPDDPGTITMDTVRPHVDESSARIVTGTAMLSLIAVLVTPVVLLTLATAPAIERTSAVVLIATTVIALTLLARHRSTPALRWIPRAASAAVVLQCAIALAATAAPSQRIALAGVLLLLALIATALLTPISRGVAPLALSRLGDWLEGLAVALALPAGMLAAGTLEFVRTTVSG